MMGWSTARALREADAMQIADAESPLQQPERRAHPAGAMAAVTERAADFSGFTSALALLAIMVSICWEVFSRYVRNEPTTWVTEISTYLLVALAFLGLAATQRARAHIHVELVVDKLAPARQLKLRVVANWIAFFFVLFCCWQSAAFVYGEWRNGTRDWGLLSTPQWIPELPIVVGFVLFAIALIADNVRIAPPRRRLAGWFALAALLGLAAVLASLGPYAVPIGRTGFDWGTLIVCAVFVAVVLALSGWRTALAVTALLAVLGIAFWLVRDGSALALGVLLAVAILAYMLLGVPIAIALGVIGVFGLYLLLPRAQLLTVGERAWTSINSFTLTAVPMFILMSTLLMQSGVTTRMFDSLVRWFGRTPGGLAHASVGASAIFAAVSGSSVATAATLGRVACPEMIERGYSPKLTYGVTAAGATLGIMIPPSIPMIIYGSTVGAPVNVLFIAGIVPGLTLALLFMIVAFVWSTTVRAAPRGRRYAMSEKLRSLVNVLPFVAVIGAVLGSLYAGVATPTEAGALGAAMSALLCVAFRRFSWRMLYDSAVQTAIVTSFIMLIVVGAAILSYVFDYLKIPRILVDTIKDAHVAPWLVIALVSLVYLILGMFVESISMILMTLPVAFPLVTALGLDPIWFGIYLVVMVELGLITPPVGMVLFVLRGVSGDVPLKDIATGALPFVAVILAFVAIMFAFPEFIAWLPSKVS
jgi:tripartite ATP-independent transporter DctM subunit